MPIPQFTVPQIPDTISDIEGRKLLEQMAPVARAIQDEQIRLQASITQLSQTAQAAITRAREVYGTDNPEELRQIVARNKQANAERLRDYVQTMQRAAERTNENMRALAAPAR